MFLKTGELSVQNLAKNLTYLPRAIAAVLAGINSVALMVQIHLSSKQYPEFLRLPYYLASLLVIGTGLAQLGYVVVAAVTLLRNPRAAKESVSSGLESMRHHEMQEEQEVPPDNKQSSRLRSHLAQQKQQVMEAGISGRETNDVRKSF